MARVKAQEFRGLTAQELDQKKFALEKDLFDLRQRRVSGQLEKPHLFKQIKRQVAQIHTLKREQENAQRNKK